MKLSHEQLSELLKRPGIAERNPELTHVSNPTQHSRKAPFVEPAFIPEPLATPSLQTAGRPSFRLRLCSVRRRLLDEDNLAARELVNLCRYRGYIPDDNAWTTKIEVTQRKCEKGEPEHVEIMIERL